MSKNELILRPPQQRAVQRTFQYWQEQLNPQKRNFLWNAKPRFGKTVAAYAFAEKIAAERILIITNRPVIADAWINDYYQFFSEHLPHIFASNKGGKYHNLRIVSRNVLIRHPDLLQKPLIYFVSLQDIKGKADNLTNFKTNNQWIFNLEKPWDLVIIDESHDGAETCKAEHVFSQLKTNFTLHLSGTPFRAIANQKFSNAQIFNWSYIDEQKESPQRQPRLSFYVSTFANFLQNQTPEKSLDFAETLRVQKRIFVHQELVEQWATKMSEFLQSPDEKFGGLNHSFWLMSSVDECYAMQSILQHLPCFNGYKINLIVGKTNQYANQSHLQKVRDGFGKNPAATKSITLSCGQLTTGVTLPEWSTVVMLYNSTDLLRTSATQYLQASFRAQNNWSDEKHIKTHCRIIDFVPERALIILKKYAENLCLSASSVHGSMQELLEYLDISEYDSAGSWRKLTAAEAVELPSRIIAKEIVDGRFTNSSKLFNDQKLYQMSDAARDVIGRLVAVNKGRIERKPRKIAVPGFATDESDQSQNDTESIRLAYDNVIKNYKYSKLSPKARNHIYNLAMLEMAINQTKQDYHSSKTSFNLAENKLIQEALAEIRAAMRRSLRKQTKDFKNNCYCQLRGFTRHLPILIHLYSEPGQTLGELVHKVPAPILEQVIGISKKDLELLYDEGYFNENNCNVAIQEFLHRKQQLSKFFLHQDAPTILKYISAECAGEIFTAPAVAQSLINKITSHDSTCFTNPQSKFFDPCAKSGALLAEIVSKLFFHQRHNYASEHDCLLHIFSQQVFAFTPNALTQNIIFNTILDFLNYDPGAFTPQEILQMKRNIIIFDPVAKQGGINMANVYQQLSETWGDDIKFDVIIGNPPYQFGRRQIYADFYRLAVELNPEILCMIFPTGWQKTYNHNGLGQLNNPNFKRDPHIVSLDNYSEKEVAKFFPEINPGSLNIILRDKKYDNHGKIQKLENGELSSKIILPISVEEISKPVELTQLATSLEAKPKMSALGSARKPYGFGADPLRHPEKYQLKLYAKPSSIHNVRLFGLSGKGFREYQYISESSLLKQSRCFKSYKIFVPKAWGNMSETVGLGGSYANICVAGPRDVCSETFIEFGPFATQAEAIKMAKYFMTKFFRALLFVAKDSQNTTKDKYCYIPVPDLSNPIWHSKVSELDQKVFELYQVSDSTSNFILQNIQPRSEENIEVL